MSDDNTLGSSERHSCCSVLVAHAAGQAQYIEKSSFFTLVRPQTASPYSRSEIGVVKCDDSLESGLLVVEISYLFVSISTDHFNVSHCVISIPIKQLIPH